MTQDETGVGGQEPTDLTPDERNALASLPREKDAGRLLEERTVRALREEGLLAPYGAGGSVRNRDERHAGPSWWRAAAALAAGIALFVGGLSVGQAMGARQTADALHTAFEGRDARLAARVQRAGSDYVASLVALSETDGSLRADSSQALEVALTALWAAANEIVRLTPDDPLAARILQGFDARARASSDYDRGGQLLVEF